MKKKIILIISIVLIILISMCLIDSYRVKKNKEPIFIFKTLKYFDGGTKEYFGPLYKIIKCNTLSGDESIHFGFYSMKIDDTCINDTNVNDLKDTYESSYLFSYKNSVYDLLHVLNLDLYGKYKYEIKNKTLLIDYYEVEGWGNIVNKNDILYEKSSIILALIDKIEKIEWKTQTNKAEITLSNINELYGNIKYYGESSSKFNELLKKLGYYNDPIKFEIKNINGNVLKLLIKNISDKEFLYGEGYNLQEYVDGKWHDVNIQMNVIAIGYILTPFEENERTYNLISSLPKGKYRLIKGFTEIVDHTEGGFIFGKEYHVFVEFEK